MTNYLPESGEQKAGSGKRNALALSALRSPLLLLVVPLLYLATLAQTPLLGDPSEFTTVAHVLGVAHPPGYAFITVLGKLFQTLLPVGSVAWRMHWLSAVVSTAGLLCVFGIVRTVTAVSNIPPRFGALAGLFAALTIGTAADHWQHSIHANPHIITATFTAANLYFLTKWWAANTPSPHHPITPSP
ncbi:MAG: DUF2723 domain-containing protein, partial [Anaerolineales bacterium]|nr:DUF2723 domain-containing protein [Anaerolineales bacterium]